MIAKRKLSVADFLLMGESGVFAPDERVELLDGEIYTMSPPSSQHAGMVKRLAKLLEQTYGERCIVSVQDPLVLNEYRLTEPDIALLRQKPSFYAEAHPQADDALLVVEVSRSSLNYNKTEKLPQYSEAGIAEVWIVDVDAGLLEVYREPVGRTYRQRTLIYPGEPVQPLAFEDKTGIIVLP
jgi:Uma2 family endonuclease